MYYFLSRFCCPLQLLDGNFPCTGLNACNAAHAFLLLTRSLGIHPICMFAYFCVYVSETLLGSLNVSPYVCRSVCLGKQSVCVCVCACYKYESECHLIERFIAVNMQDLEASVDQVSKHE